MKKYTKYRLNFTKLVLLPVFLFSLSVFGQEKKSKVTLINADELEGVVRNNISVRKLRGNVAFQQEDKLMYCDSAYFYEKRNDVEAFGHIKIVQGDSLTLTGDKLYYSGNDKFAKMRGNVELEQDSFNLYTDFLDYDFKVKQAYYYNGGDIIDKENKLHSRQGTYYTNSKLFVFKDSVRLNNPEYRIESDTMHYNTQTKKSFFQGPTTIFTDDGNLYMEEGEYSTDTKDSEFRNRVKIDMEEYLLEGDIVRYNRGEGIGKATGNVVLTSLTENTIIEGDESIYWKRKGESIVYGDPVVKFILEPGDTMFMKADTILSVKDTYNINAGVKAFRMAKLYRPKSAVNYDLDFLDTLIYNQYNSIDIDSGFADTIIHRVIEEPYPFPSLFEKLENDTLVNYGEVLWRKNYRLSESGKDYSWVKKKENYKKYFFTVNELGDTVFVKNRPDSTYNLLSINKNIFTERDTSKVKKRSFICNRLAVVKNNWKTQSEEKIVDKKDTAFIFDAYPYTMNENGTMLAYDSVFKKNDKALRKFNKKLWRWAKKQYDDSTHLKFVFVSSSQSFWTSHDSIWLMSDTSFFKADTAFYGKKVFAYNNVKIFKDDIKAKCDSLLYDMGDSVLYMFTDPVLWSEGNQMTADSVRMHMKNNKPTRMYMKVNSFIASEDSLKNYNQLKGRNMTAYFRYERMHKVRVDGNGESLFFALEGDSVLKGLNYVICSNMNILFGDSSKLKSITFIKKPEAKFMPPHEISEPDKRLKGFKWRIEEMPLRHWFYRGEELENWMAAQKEIETDKKDEEELNDQNIKKEELLEIKNQSLDTDK